MSEPGNPYATPAVQPAPPAGRTGRTIAIVGGVTLLIVGVLAWMVSLYTETSRRMDVSQLTLHGLTWKDAIREHYRETKTLPAGIAELGKNTPPPEPGAYGSVALAANGVLTLTMPEASFAPGSTLIMQAEPAGDVLNWKCKGGSLEQKYRPFECRTH